MEAATDVLLGEELTSVVTAGTLGVLDGSVDNNLVSASISLDCDLVSKVLAEVVNLHVGLEVFNEFLELEELVSNWSLAVDVEDGRHFQRKANDNCKL